MAAFAYGLHPRKLFGGCLIQMCCMTTSSTHLSTWVSSDLKRRFADTAAREGLSESALLKRLVERAPAGTNGEFAAIRQPRTPRGGVRGLRVGHSILICFGFDSAASFFGM